MKRLLAFVFGLMLIAGLAGCRKKSPEETLMAAETKLQRGDLIGARVEFREILEKNPDSPVAPQARLRLAQCYLSERDFEQAMPHLEKIVESVGLSDERAQTALDLLFQCYFNLQRYDDGLQAAEQYLKDLPPDNDFAFQMRCNVTELLFADGRTSEGLNTLVSLMESGSSHEQRMYAAERIVYASVRNQDYDRAIKTYADYIEKYPDFEGVSDLIAGQAYFYGRKGDQARSDELFQKARDSYKNAIEATLDNQKKAELYFRLAKAYELRREFDEARAQYELVIKEFSDTPLREPAQVALGDTWIMEGNNARCLEYFQVLMGREQANPRMVQAIRARVMRLMSEQRDGGTTPTATSPAPGQ